jgi:nucleoside 2-deoxyribosyltransferase
MKTCFVIMPIGSDEAYRTYLNRYESLIKPAIEGVLQDGERIFDAIRADFISSTGSINRTVLRHLYQADVVIADLTDLNPNVFYELGVRHSLRHGTILMALKGTKPPFDVGDLRVIPYEDKLGAEKATIPEIQRLLRAVLHSHAEDSPVFQAVPELGTATRAPAEAEARISALESEARELRAKLSVAEQIGLNFRESFGTFESTVRSMFDRLSPKDRETAEAVVETAFRTQSETPKRLVRIPSSQSTDPQSIFVLMPFAKDTRAVYDIIRSAAGPLGFRVWRADEIASAGLITDQILDAISKARLIVADVTGKNPNVLYEIGMAHSLGKDVILIAQSGEIIPFDIAAFRVLFYEQSLGGSEKLRKDLQMMLLRFLES